MLLTHAYELCWLLFTQIWSRSYTLPLSLSFDQRGACCTVFISYHHDSVMLPSVYTQPYSHYALIICYLCITYRSYVDDDNISSSFVWLSCGSNFVSKSVIVRNDVLLLIVHTFVVIHMWIDCITWRLVMLEIVVPWMQCSVCLVGSCFAYEALAEALGGRYFSFSIRCRRAM